MMALASAAMLTIVSGIAVMTRPPRAQLVAPSVELSTEPKGLSAAEREKLERALVESTERQKRMDELLAPHEAEAERNQQRVLCRTAVHRGDIDGRPEPYDECIVPYAKGDVFVFYSDGVSEAMNASGDEFGRDNIADVVQSRRGASAREIVDAIFEAVAAFRGDALQNDDITAVVVRAL